MGRSLITPPGQRPLRTRTERELETEFERALAEGDGVTGAHCIHERWMRGQFPAHIEASLDTLWKRAGESIPDWLPMRYVSWLPTAYEIAARFSASGGRSNIYLVLLDYSDRRGDDHGVYVGMSRYSPAAAFRPAQGRHPCGRQRAQARHRSADGADAPPPAHPARRGGAHRIRWPSRSRTRASTSRGATEASADALQRGLVIQGPATESSSRRMSRASATDFASEMARRNASRASSNLRQLFQQGAAQTVEAEVGIEVADQRFDHGQRGRGASQFPHGHRPIERRHG